jgi:alpha-galactosidase
LFNRGLTNATISVAWEDIGYPARVKAEVRDLWAGKNLGKFKGSFTKNVPPHDAIVLKIMP